uniref:BTB domain-containing protein n=1 Tax=Panagrolaimus sp. ES5 TaxID=591445 RepID=A0AC34F6Y4_9BILA
MECSTTVNESSFNGVICPFEIECKFQKANLIALKDSENGFLEGKCFYAFNILGLQYCVRIYPNGNDKESLGETWVFLHVNGSKKRKITAEFTISIESAGYTENFRDVFKCDEQLGFECCQTADFFGAKNKYFVDREITVKVEGILKAETSSVTTNSRPISMRWKIDENLLKSTRQSQNRRFHSKRIKIASYNDLKYFLSICPNRIRHGKQPHTRLYLNIEMTKEKHVEAVYVFSLDSVNFNRGEQYKFEKSKGHAITLCSTEDLFDSLKGYFIDGFLTVNFNGILIIGKSQPTVLNCEKGLAPKNDQQKQYKEFTIFVEEKEIKVHRKILMDASPVWTGMFESGMKESVENKMFIEDFPFKIVDAAINIFYSNNVPRKFSFEDILSLYKFADKYEIHLIMDLVEKYFIRKLSPSNVVHLIHFSKDFSIKKLHQSCIDFLSKCSKNSTPVYGSESLDKDFIVSLFTNSLLPCDYTFA